MRGWRPSCCHTTEFRVDRAAVLRAWRASGTGWLDVRTRTWSRELLRATDPDRDLAACLPPIAAPDALFDIAPKAAAALGLQRR